MRFPACSTAQRSIAYTHNDSSSVNLSTPTVIPSNAVCTHWPFSSPLYNSGHYPSSCLLFKTQLNSVCLSVPNRKHITSPLRAQRVNAIYRFVTMVYQYNCHNSGHYPSSRLLFKTWLNFIGLSVPHRRHITSPLRAQQVNAIYRFVTMVY
jgi:hypothetical protein